MTEIDHSARAHEINGPSSLHRRMACVGSRGAEDGLPDTTSPAAEEGTRAHELLEKLLLGGNPKGDEPVEMMQAVMEAKRWVDNYPTYELHVEKKVDPSWVLGECTAGTADIILISHKHKHVIVADFKYGSGHDVSAVLNPQLLALAAGVQAMFLGQDTGYRFTMAILQPRVRTGATVKTSELDYDGIFQEWFKIRDRLILTWDSIAEETPTQDACHFCKAKLTCAARLETIQDGVNTAFATVGSDLPATQAFENTGAGIEGLSDGMLSQIMDLEGQFNALLSDVRAEATVRIRGGTEIPGYKIIRGAGNRKWSLEEADLRRRFKSMKLTFADYENVKIKSPSQLEKLEKLTEKQRVNLSKLWIKPKGADKLVISSAKGEAIEFNADKAFEDAIQVNSDQTPGIISGIADPIPTKPHSFL